MIKPVRQDRALLDDIRSTSRDDEHFRLWWLGQSGFLLQFRGSHLLFDPYLSDSLTKKYEKTFTPHVRMTERAVDPARLDFIQTVLCSHAHTDHMDPETLTPLFAANPKALLVCPKASVQVAAERAQSACAIHGMDEGECMTLPPFRVTAIASAHEEIERTDSGHMRYLGFVVEFGSWSVYHSGDTVMYQGLAERLQRLQVTAALLPINGRGRGVAGNLNEREAASLGRQIGARVVVPCHYDMFAFNTGNSQVFAEAAAEEGQSICVLPCGGSWSSVSLR